VEVTNAKLLTELTFVPTGHRLFTKHVFAEMNSNCTDCDHSHGTKKRFIKRHCLSLSIVGEENVRNFADTIKIFQDVFQGCGGRTKSGVQVEGKWIGTIMFLYTLVM
jgi:hypothetical protein